MALFHVDLLARELGSVAKRQAIEIGTSLVLCVQHGPYFSGATETYSPGNGRERRQRGFRTLLGSV